LSLDDSVRCVIEGWIDAEHIADKFYPMRLRVE
jgi:hypothetical protein